MRVQRTRDYIHRLHRNGDLKIEYEIGETTARTFCDDTRFKWSMIRNPWAWYVSRYQWFHHYRWVTGNTTMATITLAGIDHGIVNATTESDADSFLDHMRKGFASDRRRDMSGMYAADELGREPFEREGFRQSGYGAWPSEPFFAMTGCYRDMLCTANGTLITDFVGRIEDGLEEPYKLAGVPSGIDKFSNHHVLKYAPFQTWYDDETKRMVAEVDAEIIDRHGYSFNDIDPARSA